MVDVSGKDETLREAVAAGRVVMLPETLGLILDKKASKGDVFGVARVAGIMAAKKTADLIPMCHTLNLASVEVAFEPDKSASCVNILVRSKTPPVRPDAMALFESVGWNSTSPTLAPSTTFDQVS